MGNAKRNLNYLFSPTTANVDKPARLRTRALLRTCRYIGQFIIWRLVRWAKYAAVGALIAAVGGRRGRQERRILWNRHGTKSCPLVMTSKSLVGMGVCLRAQGRVRTPEMTGDTGQSPTLDAHANTEEQVSKCACGDSEA